MILNQSELLSQSSKITTILAPQSEPYLPEAYPYIQTMETPVLQAGIQSSHYFRHFELKKNPTNQLNHIYTEVDQCLSYGMELRGNTESKAML